MDPTVYEQQQQQKAARATYEALLAAGAPEQLACAAAQPASFSGSRAYLSEPPRTLTPPHACTLRRPMPERRFPPPASLSGPTPQPASSLVGLAWLDSRGPESTPNRHRILIVDDDPGLRDGLTEQLSLHEEFEAVAVENGIKGV
jgi:hypothetical protein